jgi:phosphate starvation-inducible PhoH-like protein
MKMFLTRIGFGSKAVITGDVSQVDLPLTQLSGLIDAERIMKRVQGIAITRLTSADVVRHPLVARIVDAYDKHRSAKADVNAADEEADDVVDVKAPGSAKPARKTRRKV